MAGSVARSRLDHMTESTKHLNRKLSLMQNMLGWPASKNVHNVIPERSGPKTKKDGGRNVLVLRLAMVIHPQRTCQPGRNDNAE